MPFHWFLIEKIRVLHSGDPMKLKIKEELMHSIDIHSFYAKTLIFMSYLSNSPLVASWFQIMIGNSCYPTVPNVISEKFSEFLNFGIYFTSLYRNEIMKKHEKRGKYLPILHEATFNNYFIVKSSLKSNVLRAILLNY